MVQIADHNNKAPSVIEKINGTLDAGVTKYNGIDYSGSFGGTIYNNFVDYSCMFNPASFSYMTYSNPASGSLRKFTVALWFKRTGLMGSDQRILSGWEGAATDESYFGFDADDHLFMKNYVGGANEGHAVSQETYKDQSNWFHLIVTCDRSLGNSASAMQFYINGDQINMTWSDPLPVNGDHWFMYFGQQVHLCSNRATAANFFDGYLADVHILNDTYVSDWQDFATFNQGVLVPRQYTNHNATSFYLDFADSANLGNDVSGNNRDWVGNGIGADHRTNDTPEDNYCILDYNTARSDITNIAEGGLAIQDAGTAYHTALGTFLLETGKWYWELDVGSDIDDPAFGVWAADRVSGQLIDSDLSLNSAFGWNCLCNGSLSKYVIYNGGTTDDDNLDAPAANDVMLCAYDADTGKLWFGLYNAGSGTVWGDFGASGVGDPANGNNPSFTITNFAQYSIVPGVTVWATITAMANFGQRTFSGTKPTGFNAVCSSNLTYPTVLNPQDEAYYDGRYDGTGAELVETGVGFQPDMVWIKNYDRATNGIDNHRLFDSVRGATVFLEPDRAVVQETVAQSLKSFDSDGFTLGTANDVNDNTEDYGYFCWQIGTDYGFDIQTYEGTGAAHTESHDLGVVPDFIMVKNVDVAREWNLYHRGGLTTSDPETDKGVLSTTAIWADDATAWNDVAPTSANFSVGTSNSTNENNQTFIAYLWASVPGYSRAFRYIGNGATTGTYVHCGFRPRFVMIKNITSVDEWALLATNMYSAHPNWVNYNPQKNYIRPDDDQILGANLDMDFYSNGFKLLNTDVITNEDDSIFIGMAFAEQPFKFSNAR